MLKWIREEYNNPFNDRINTPIIKRQYEKSLEEYVVDCFKSISNVLPEIQMTGYKFIVDVDKVNQTDYERVRSNRQKDKQQKYIYMNDSRLGELIMDFRVDYEFEGNAGVLEYTRKILIPIPDENNYFYIKGKRYILQYQITESSTYTTSSALVGKSLLPIKVRRSMPSIRILMALNGSLVIMTCLFSTSMRISCISISQLEVGRKLWNTLKLVTMLTLLESVMIVPFIPISASILSLR